jgi:hypothetical protein
MFFKTLLIQSGMSVTFFSLFWEQDKVYSDNPHTHTHWINLSKACMKKLHLSRSMNWN